MSALTLTSDLISAFCTLCHIYTKDCKYSHASICPAGFSARTRGRAAGETPGCCMGGTAFVWAGGGPVPLLTSAP